MQENKVDKAGINARSDTKGLAVSLLIAGSVIGLLAATLFYLLPHLDIMVSKLFFVSEQNKFFGAKSSSVELARLILMCIFGAICVFVCAGFVMTIARRTPCLGQPSHKWLICAICLIIGPLVVSNLVLKNTWGRARPGQIVEFSGSKTYSPPLTPSDQCPRNCSFISGEASNQFMAFFALAFLFLAHARLLLTAGIVMGALGGLVRMSQGAHFLSDVIFAGVFMAISVAVVQLLSLRLAFCVKPDTSGATRKSLA